MRLAATFALALCVPLTLRAQRDPKVIEKAEKSYKPTTATDPFTKRTQTNVEIRSARDLANRPACSHTRGLVLIGIQGAVVSADSVPKTPFLVVSYAGPEWLFLDDAEPVLFLVTGDSVVTPPIAGTPERRVVRSSTSEWVSVQITADEVLRLARAPSLRMRLAGRQGRCDLTLRPEDQERFRLFAERELSASGAP